MFLCWGESDLSIAFSTHPGSQASSRGEAKNTALLSSRDGYILELTVWPKMSQASCGVWREDSGLLSIRVDLCIYIANWGFPGGSDVKESACNAGYPGLIPGSGRSPGEGNGYPLQYSCQEDSMDRGVWKAAVQGVVKSWTRLSD